MHDMFKKKKMCKKNQNAFKYGWKHVSRRCGSYMKYLKGNSPHQVVMIMCEWNGFSHISNRHNMRHLYTIAMFSHTTRKFFATLDKTHFTSIWINLSRFKMIITSGYIEDMKITQELLKKSVICRSQYLLNKSSICWDSLKLDTCLDLSSLRDSNYSQQSFYSKRLFVYGFE